MADQDETIERGMLDTTPPAEPETPAEPSPESATPEPETPEEKPEAPKPGEPEYSKAVQKRIGDLTRARREEERRRQALEAENAALKRKLEAGVRPLPPDPKDFADEQGLMDPAKWQRAMSTYEDKLHAWRQAQAADVPVAASASGSEPEPAADPTLFLERAAVLKQTHPDFDQVVNRPVFTPALRDVLFDSDHGAEIAYFLGKHEAEAMRIGALPREQLNREVGRLEARFAAQDSRRTVSAAPEPITPVRGTAVVEKDPEKMSIDDYMKWENQRLLERRKTAPF